MAWYNQFPWTNFHELNLDWVMKQIQQNQNNINLILSQIGDSSGGEGGTGTLQLNVLTVGKSNAMFTTINKAIEHARSYCNSVNNRVVIVVYPGTYNEDITLVPNPGIDMVGLGRPKIVSTNSGYPQTSLYTAGEGYFQGLEFVANGSTYGVHVEVQDVAGLSGGNIVFESCRFTNTNGSGIGAGLGMGNNLICNNCEFSCDAGAYGAYVHNYPGKDDAVSAVFTNCNFAMGSGGCIRLDDAAKIYGSNVAPLYVTFFGCSVNTGVQVIDFRYSSYTDTYNGVYLGSNISMVNCGNCNHPALLYYVNETYYQWTVTSTLSNTYRVPFDLESKLFKTVTVTSLFVNGGITLTGSWDAVVRGASALGLVAPETFYALTMTDVLVSYTATW